MRFSNLPNAITIVRLAIAPVVAVLILRERWGEALACFLAAGASDGLDGKIARKFNIESDFGAMLDPIADKALMILATWTLAFSAALPLWFAALVTARDVAVMLGAWLTRGATDRPRRIRPLFVSKLNTAAHIVLLCATLAALAFGWPLSPWLTPALVVVATLSVASFAAYVAREAGARETGP